MYIAALSSCEQKITSTKADVLSEYKGYYEIFFMDWTTTEKNINTVDLDNNGCGSNDLMSELLGLPNRFPVLNLVSSKRMRKVHYSFIYLL